MTGLSMRLIRLAEEAKANGTPAGVGFPYKDELDAAWRKLQLAVADTLGSDVAAAMDPLPPIDFYLDYHHHTVRLQFAGLADILCEWKRDESSEWHLIHNWDNRGDRFFEVETAPEIAIDTFKTIGEAICAASRTDQPSKE